MEWIQELKLTEPQVTKCFAHALNHADRTIRKGRIGALLRVLGSEPGEDDSNLGKGRVTPEARTNGGRIDLLIEWTDASDHERGAIIEAKFAHHVTPGTLPRYRAHLERIESGYRNEVRDGEQDRPLLFIVSPRRDAKLAQALRRQRKKVWRWMSWRSLLLAYDRVLHPDHDDDAFREFRRTLWTRAG